MSVAYSVAEILRDHVTLAVESLDRVYLNVYVPKLQYAQGVAAFFRFHRGHKFASSVLMAPMTRAFIAEIEAYLHQDNIPLLTFTKGQRKDDLAAEYLKRFTGQEGLLFVGKAQENVPVFRTEKRRNPQTGRPYAWIVRSSAPVNHYYFYGVDRDFGPFFLKFCSYFPYTAKLCFNGHEYAKRQLAQAGIAFEALDNGFLNCADPARLQAICDELSAEKIDTFAHKWLARLPQPFTPDDRAAGYGYQLSILQAECSLTQVLDRPVTGRIFFEQVIRENLDLGRPDQVKLIFGRRVSRRTPGRFQTRVITQGVTPSLYVNYKSSRIKQYHKEGRAPRTETTVNNPNDFGLPKRLSGLPALRAVGFATNRRLLDVQRISHDCALGEAAFQQVNRPVVVGAQRASALHFADPRVQAVFSVLVLFRLLPEGFANADLREHLAPVLGLVPSQLTPECMTYHLRRLRLHGLIERLPHRHRYRVTDRGLRIALFFTRTYARLLRPGLSHLRPETLPDDSPLGRRFNQLEAAIDLFIGQAALAA
jgi:hypothetical protein